MSVKYGSTDVQDKVESDKSDCNGVEIHTRYHTPPALLSVLDGAYLST